jgi:hypothetical protein
MRRFRVDIVFRARLHHMLKALKAKMVPAIGEESDWGELRHALKEK